MAIDRVGPLASLSNHGMAPDGNSCGSRVTNTPLEAEAASAPSEMTIRVPGNHLMAALLGQRDEYLRVIEARYEGASIHVRGNEITVAGERADLVGTLFRELDALLEQGQRLDIDAVTRTVDMVEADERPSEVLGSKILRAPNGRVVRPKSSGQQRYVRAIRDNIITFICELTTVMLR